MPSDFWYEPPEPRCATCRRELTEDNADPDADTCRDCTEDGPEAA